MHGLQAAALEAAAVLFYLIVLKGRCNAVKMLAVRSTVQSSSFSAIASRLQTVYLSVQSCDCGELRAWLWFVPR